MAFPHALRHALVAVLLRRVAAHEAKACREWGHPKEGKWQKDEDCCAGSEQAACAAGHRYVKGDVCHKEVECKAFSYECELCQPGEACDTNYDVATEKGEDYDCKQNLWSGCYFLWPIAWIFFYLAIRRVNKLIAEGNQSQAKRVWIQVKWAAFVIFLACSFLHFIAELWMGLYGVGLILPYCFFLGAFIPLACCYYGDRVVGIPFTKGFLRELPFSANEAPATQMVTTSAPFKEYDEPPVVTRLPSESNITKTYLLVPVEELVVRRVVRRVVVLLFIRLVATRDDRVDDRVEGLLALAHGVGVGTTILVQPLQRIVDFRLGRRHVDFARVLRQRRPSAVTRTFQIVARPRFI